MNAPRLRFGVYVDGLSLRRWELDAIALIEESGEASCRVLILGRERGKANRSRRRLHGAVDEFLGSVIAAELGEAFERVSSHNGMLENVTRLDYRSDRGFGTDAVLPDGELQEIRRYRLDFILHLGRSDIPHGLSDAATYGVWQFSRSVEPFGLLSCLDALRRGETTVTFALHRIGPKGEIMGALRAGRFRAVALPHRAVCRDVVSQARRWPLLVARYLRLNGKLPDLEDVLPLGNGRRVTPWQLLVSLGWRDLRHLVGRKLGAVFTLETWRIGLVRMPAEDLLKERVLREVVWLPKHKIGHYVADPFILRTEPTVACLVEDYSYFGRGKISELELGPDSNSAKLQLRTRLDAGYHFSYPFLFEDNGVTYCLPETHENNRSTLYRVAPGGLTRVCDIIEGSPVTDGTLFFHEGRYWLFCGLETDLDQGNLYIFFSDELRRGWQPHPLNPVKTDIASSRSAGPVITVGGRLFRPAQNCSTSYGYGISLNRIEVLSPTMFAETTAVELFPETVSRGCRGIHTLSFHEELLVLDGKFHSYGLAPLIVQLYRMAIRIRNRFWKQLCQELPLPAKADGGAEGGIESPAHVIADLAPSSLGASAINDRAI